MEGALVSLSHHHEDALERFLAEFDAQPNQLHGYFCGRDWPIERVVQTLVAWSEGRLLEANYVPCSTWFWEVDGTLAGVINLRHRLSPELEELGGHIGYSVAPSHRRQGVATHMLGAVLERCRHFGIQRTLLTCDAHNRGSCRTIEINGGQLERELWNEELQRKTRYYSIVVP